jgi:hypothetical protein
MTLTRRAVECMQHALCALRGHLYVLHVSRGHLSLRCFACGAETPGWSV